MNREHQVRRITDNYARRTTIAERYDSRHADVALRAERRRAVLEELLKEQCRHPFSELRLLEIGCGRGQNLEELIEFGFDPDNLVGNELLAERAEEAKRRLPSTVPVHVGDALALEAPPESFDIVYQSMVFTSIPEPSVQIELAKRMWSWVRRGGSVLWYDFVCDNPFNADVAGVPLRRVAKLFPDARLVARRVTLAPPLARLACIVHPSIYGMLDSIPWLRTHRFCWLEKS